MDYGSSEKRAKRLPEQTAVLTLTTVDGRTFRERVDFPKGEPENPFNEQEFYGRYAELMRFGGADQEKIDSVYHMVKDGTVSAGALALQL